MANATNPSESLALRYSYAQLQHPYKAYADQVSALMRAYGKILSVENAAERQGMVAKAQAWVNGHKPSDEEISKFTGPLKEFAQAIGLGGVGTVFNVGKGAAGAAGTAIDGVMLPLDVFKGGLGAIGTFFNEATNFQLSEAQAREIGTAYGSVLQAQSQQRGSWYSSLDNVMAYASAAFSYAIDWVTSLFKGTECKSWGEHVQRAFMDSDRKVVAREFAKVSDIGGVSGEKLGKFLANGGVAQNAAGTNMTVAPPTTDNPVPAAPAAPTTPEGEPVVAPRDIAATVGDALNKGGSALVEPVADRLNHSSPNEKAMAGALGAATGSAILYGAAGRMAQRHVEAGHTKPVVEKIAKTAEAAKITKNPVTWFTALGRGMGSMASTVTVPVVNAAGHVKDGTAMNALGRTALSAAHVAGNAVEGAMHGGATASGQHELAARTHANGMVGKVFSAVGKVGTYSNVLEPVAASVRTFEANGRNDTAGVIINGGEVAAIAGTAIKFTARRALPVIAPIASSAELANAAREGDKRGMVTAGTELGTIGSFVAGGALIGGPVGATAGLVIGGILSIATGWGAGKVYDHNQPAPDAVSAKAPANNPARDGAAGTADPGLAAAAIDHAKAQQAAQAAAGGMRAANVKIGAVRMNEDGSLPPLRFTGPGAEPLVIS